MASPQGQPLPQDFQPMMDAKRTRSALDYLKKNPALFNEQQRSNLEQHASYWGLPYYDGEFNVSDAIYQAVGGFVEGFTTLNIAEQPDNEYEAIIRNIGHLAGFAPGIMASPAKYLGLKGAARMFSSINDASVPMFIAKHATKKAKDLAKPIFSTALKGRAGAAGTAAEFLTGNRARHIMEGAFHLGTASAVSAWQGGVDQMMEAFKGGAQAGAIFRVIGNLSSTNPSKGQTMIKAMAGSLFQGLPSTMRGATTPEQIYEYLLGAYFGGKEVPWTVAKVNKGIVAMRKRSEKDPDFNIAKDPEMLPEWKTMPEEVKPMLKKKAEEIWGKPEDRLAAAQLLAIESGNRSKMDDKAFITPEGIKLEKVVEKGEERIKIDDATAKKYKHYIVSGGSQGMENIISGLAKKYNVPVFHYVAKRGDKKGNISGQEIPLTSKQLEEANVEVRKAESALLEKIGKLSSFEINNIKRSWPQIRDTQSSYIFGYLSPNNKRVKGLMGWSAQMGINNNKPVTVFDMARKKWYSYEPAVEKFINIPAPPKPTRKVAILGQFNKITGEAKKQAEAFFNANFKGIKNVESKEVESPKQQIELDNIQDRINEIDQELTYKVGTVAENLVKERAKLESRKVEIETDVVDKLNTEEKTESKEIDTDVGSVEDRTVGKVSFYFADKYLNNVWNQAPDPTTKVVEKFRIAQKIENAIEKYLNPNSKRNRSPEWANEVEQWVRDEFNLKKFKLDKEARLDMRAWMRRRNTDRSVRQAVVENGKIKFLDKDNPVTKMGNRKLIREPQKRLEEVYEDAGGKEEAYVVLDTISEKVDGVWKDKSFSDFRRGKKDSEWKKFIGDIMVQMNKKNLYAFGGAGDKDQIFFVKYHPNLKSLQTSDMAKMFTQVKTTYLKDVITEAQKDYGISEKEFQKQWMSNLAYEAEMNGMTMMDYVNTMAENPGNFIQSAKAWNKRAQIWWTNSYSGDGEFVQQFLAQTKGAKNDLVDGNYKYKLIDDSGLTKEQWADLKNSKLPEHVDGMIIVRDDVIDAINADAGHPDSGQNKSFIIAPHAQRGAMLGKYMMHAAGKTQTADMQKEGLHFKIMDSAAKQRGVRDYETPYTDLAPEHIKYNMSTKQTEHMLEPQRIPKQLMGSLVNHAMFNINKNVIDGFFRDIVENRFNGQKKFNVKMQDYLDFIEQDKFDQKTADRMMSELESNIDKIGMVELLRALRTPNNHMFTEKVWENILKLNTKSLSEELAAGEINNEQYADRLNEVNEFSSIADRMLMRSREWTAQQRKAGKDVSAVSTFLHKFVTHYRTQAIRNYMVDSVSKPRIDNSGVARIRPFDPYLMRDADNVNPRLKELETNDEIFFLDDAYRNMNVYIGKSKRMTLGEAYEKYSKIKNKKSKEAKELEETFESVIMRVPMDSISGAHRVKFAGFTGRKGHGILMHARAMRALGGADLDGDEAWFFMGGQRGFKKSWRDAFGANKREFYEYTNGKKTISPLEYDALSSKEQAQYRGTIKDNKTSFVQHGVHTGKTHSQVLANQLTEAQKAKEDSFEYMFAPTHRIEVSRRTKEGRNMLGTAVTQKQIMSSMYAAIQAGEGKETYEFRRKVAPKKWETFQVTIVPRTSIKAQQAAREMGRAQVALGSDPMDESGLKGGDVWFKALYNLHFKPVSIKKLVNNKWVDAAPKEKKLEVFEMKNGIYNKLAKMNSAFYGRDHGSNRKWSLSQIKEMSDGVWDLEASQNNTLLTKVGRLLNKSVGLVEDNMISRINRPAVKELYDTIEMETKGNEWLQKILGRNTFKVKLNNDIDNVLINKLNTIDGLKDAASDYKIFLKSIKGTRFDNQEVKERGLEGYREQGENKAREYRANILKKMTSEADHFFLNDMTDAVTAELIINIAKKMKNPKDLERIHKKVESLKKKSALMTRARNNAADLPLSETLKQLTQDKTIRRLHQAALKELDWLGGSVKKDKVKTSAELDQVEIDARISEFKAGLSKNGKEAFDVLMLGSLNRGNLSKLSRFTDRVSKQDKQSRLVQNYLAALRKEASRTSLSRLGFQSLQVSDTNIRNFLGAISSKFDAAIKNTATDKDIKTVIENVNNDKSIEGDGAREVQDLVQMTTGYEGLKDAKGTVTPEMKKVISRIATNLKTYDPHVRANLNQLVRGLFQKDLNAMNLEEFRIFDEWTSDMKAGTIWQRMFDKKGMLNLSGRHYYLFPSTIGREFMRDDLQLLHEKGWFFTAKGEKIKGDIARPSSYINVIQSWIGRMNDASARKTDELIQGLQERLIFLNTLKGGEALREVAIRMREKGFAENVLLKNDKIDPRKKHAQMKDYLDKWLETSEKHDWDVIKNEKYTLDVDGKRVSLTGREVVDKINEAYTNTFKEMHKIITGDPKALEPYIEGHYDAQKLYPKLDYKKFVRDLANSWKKGEDVSDKFGIDGLRMIAREMMGNLIGDSDIKKAFRLSNLDKTGKIPFQYYWPHMFFNKKEASKYLEITAKNILKDATMTREDKLSEIENLMYRNKSLTGDWEFRDISEWQYFDKAAHSISDKKKMKKKIIKHFNADEKAGAMFTRGTHVGGWSIDGNVPESYIKSLSNTYYRQLSQIFSREMIERMGTQMAKQYPKEQQKAWRNFMKLYVQGAMGNPDVIPDEILKDKNMKLQGTLYAKWADDKVLERVNKIGAKLGLIKGNKKLPKELRQFDLNQLRHWSNLEAQFEMASLLVHPKTVVGNIFGGSMHTIQSTGWRNWKNSFNYSYLSKINPEWTNAEAVDRFVVESGVYPERMIYEFGLSKETQNVRNKEFIKDVAAKVSRDPELKQNTLVELSKKHGVTDRVRNWAAKWMSVPERKIRRDAFMAHYIQWFNKFGGAIKDYNDPFLIELAKKGVKATQFLYSAPFRPAFSRTALGKVMSRFMTWSWNAVKFRNEVNRQAKIYGYRQGTAEYERFKRTTQIDMFVFALGNIFAYSLFDTAMPAPYTWFEDTAQWIYGDEEERDKAFFGQWPTAIAPLQIVTPPIARVPLSVISSIANDDYNRLAQYYVYTMFPFGRLGRDFSPFAKGNVIDNPINAISKWTGMPLLQLQRKSTENKKEPVEKIYPKGLL